MPKLHIDADIGGDIDDLCALAMALDWPDVELLAITTVAEHRGKRAPMNNMLRRELLPRCAYCMLTLRGDRRL